jgi:HEAT repeat protein
MLKEISLDIIKQIAPLPICFILLLAVSESSFGKPERNKNTSGETTSAGISQSSTILSQEQLELEQVVTVQTCIEGTLEQKTNFTKKLIMQDLKNSLHTSFDKKNAIFERIKICNQNAAPALERLLQIDQNAKVREVAVEALRRIGGTTAINALIRALKYDQDGDVRREIAKALGKIGGTNATDALGAALENSTQPESVREAVAMALGNTGELGITKLAAAIQSTDLNTRYLAVTELARIGNSAALIILDEKRLEVIEILDKYRYQEELHITQLMSFLLSSLDTNGASIGLLAQLQKKPSACNIKWVANYWKKCR